MAEFVVSFLVERLGMFVEKEVKLLKGVRRDIEFIRDEFERMRAFLQRAESSQEDGDEFEVWVKQVRELAYDTEDILDEFTLNFARDPGHGFARYFHKIKSSIHNLKARHHISSKIAYIKSKITEISEGNQRYRDQSHCTEPSASASTRATPWQDLRDDAVLVDEDELVGIDRPRNGLIKWLVDGEPGLEVVSIFGMGGSGKTTLARSIYDNDRVKDHFQSHAWITVSQSSKIEDLLRGMIAQLYGETGQQVPPGIESKSGTELKRTVKNFLQKKRYVIVLDDVWNSGALKGIKIAMPNNSFGSRMIITTRMYDVATCCSDPSKVYKLERLSEEESWLLFCKKAFRGSTCPPNRQHPSRQILKKCGGLPLAVVIIGGLLYEKGDQEWEMISRSLAAGLESDDTMQNFRKILSLSYNELGHHLKSCFLYLGVFPEDHVIECMRLIRLWIAERFVEEKEGMTLEEVAEGYLKKLINRSLVQIAETTLDGRIRSCRIHDLMRESILSESRDINFLSLSKQETKLHGKVRRLSVQSIPNNTMEERNLPTLRSLLIFESGKLSSSNEEFFPTGSKLLRVLDLRGLSLHKFPRQIPVLFHLKYLSLRGTKVRIVPRSIGKLQNLETLDLKQTLVSELPVEITKLKKLRHLLVYSYAPYKPSRPFCSITGFSAPRGIGELAALQKLCYVKVGGARSKKTMQELGKLSQLRRLRVTDLKKDDAKELCHSLEKMTHLRSLGVTAESESEVIDLDFLSSPPSLLRGLYIKGCLKKLPHWLPLLNNLATVRLKWTRLKSSPLITLQNLPNLVDLQLIKAFDGETLVFGDGGFPKLKNLSLSNMENLRFVSMDGRAMPCLQSLVIGECRHLDWQSLLVAIRGLVNLKLLEFFEMPEEFALAFYPESSGRMREGILQEYYAEVMARNPQVHFVWWNEDEDDYEWYDLDCYDEIEWRVMSRDEGSCSSFVDQSDVLGLANPLGPSLILEDHH